MAQILINVTSGTSSKGLRIKEELTNIYSLDVDKVRNFLKSAIAASLFDSSVTAQMIQNNIEEID